MSQSQTENPSANPSSGAHDDGSSQTVRSHIDGLIADGKLTADRAQDDAIAALDGILEALSKPRLANKKSALGWMFGAKQKPARSGPRGLYLWGGVGRGKTMLMDLFYELAPAQPKRRVHFHAFMQDVHGRIHKWRQAQKTSKDRTADPIPPLADALSNEAKLLCFDEFAVTDVADAMILARLFTVLFERGVTVVATSNVVPKNLYKDGLNRSFFLPFIALVEDKMLVAELDSPTDYRMETLINGDVYFIADCPGYEAMWSSITGKEAGGSGSEPVTIIVKGRELHVPRAFGGIARMSFDELCRKPLGAGDYLALVERFHTLFISSVPVMDHADRNAVKRFIALIDTLYDAGRVVIIDAATPPSALYPVDHGTEAFEFQRTISRLREMQGKAWLEGAAAA